MWRSLVLVIAFVACRVPPAVPALPSKGGPKWAEFTSAHFTIWTDAPERGNDLVQTMERLREVIYGTAMFGTKDLGYRTFVVALANKEEVGAYLPKEFSAYAHSAGHLMQPSIIVAADSLETIDSRRILTHELTHVISYGPLPNQPHWFSEALATFYETAELDGTRVDLGKPSPGRTYELKAERPLPFAQLFACREHGCMTGRFYATAWAMFTWLATEHAEELFGFMARLSTAREGQEDALWAQSFPSLANLNEADHQFAAWIAHGKILVRQYTVKQASYTSQQQPLGDADALVARGIADMFGKHDVMPKDVEAAIAIDPTHVLARLVEVGVRGGIPADQARGVTTAHPDDWRSWYILMRSTTDSEEQRNAWHKACEIVARDFVPLPFSLCSH